jgi:thiol:disulfide interchange protein DsbC
MKIFNKEIMILIFLSISLAVGTVAFAGGGKSSPEAVLQKLFPKLRYKSISKTDIDGLYEVITNDRIVYFYPKKGYLFVGDIVTKEGRSLTRERFADERYKLLTNEDLKKAIKIGNGKNIVIEVTDPDCPFCRKMHAYWSMRTDVTRYVFLKPLDMHPDAKKKSKYILASSDRERALFEAYCGNLDDKRDVLDKVYDDKGMLDAQKAIADKLQVAGTPSYWVNGKFVSGANIPMIESIIGKAGNTGMTEHAMSDSSCGELKQEKK